MNCQEDLLFLESAKRATKFWTRWTCQECPEHFILLILKLLTVARLSLLISMSFLKNVVLRDMFCIKIFIE